MQELLSLRMADSALAASNAQIAMGIVGIGTLLVAAVGVVKVENDLRSLRLEQEARDVADKKEQAERDVAYKKEQAARDAAASALLNATVLLITREAPPLSQAEAARLTLGLLLPATPPSDASSVTLHLPKELRAATARFSPDTSASSLHTWVKLTLLAQKVSPQRPYELRAVWAKGLAEVTLADEQALTLRSAGMAGDAEVTLVWKQQGPKNKRDQRRSA
jgi:hypothetical protein